MSSTQSSHVRHSRHRLGFTLIELLVVIGLIAVLAAMSVSAFYQVAVKQQDDVTKTTIKKLVSMVKDEWDAVIDQAKAESTGGLTRAQYINNRLAQEFPMTFAEALAGGRASYAAALSGVTISNDTPATNSAACLYLALKQNRRGMNIDLDNVLTPQSIRTRPDGLKEIVDGRGFTLAFTRANNPPAGTDPYIITSAGPDGMLGNLDDISSTNLR